MSKLHSWKPTVLACYCGYITQAISINLLPLLFAIVHKEFEISLTELGMLPTATFVVQILIDLVSARIGDRLRYRFGAVSAHVLTTVGLISLSVLPFCMRNAYTGIFISTLIMSAGGGLIEVLISPIVDNIPSKEKSGTMTLLHSFYCWGSLGVVLLTTAFFAFFGQSNWRWLPGLWAIFPLLTAILFTAVRMPEQPEAAAAKNEHTLRYMFRRPSFWVMMVLMLCAGGSEMAIAQWASLFAEVGLGVPKAVGDLLGPCGFALLMGSSRVFFGLHAGKYNLQRALTICSFSCAAGFALVVFSPWSLLSLIGVGVCGLSVGLLWPGVYSLSSAAFPKGGTAMFALLAMCGDIGCATGAGLVGAVSDSLQTTGTPILTALKIGILIAALFPLGTAIGVLMLRYKKQLK